MKICHVKQVWSLYGLVKCFVFFTQFVDHMSVLPLEYGYRSTFIYSGVFLQCCTGTSTKVKDLDISPSTEYFSFHCT